MNDVASFVQYKTLKTPCGAGGKHFRWLYAELPAGPLADGASRYTYFMRITPPLIAACLLGAMLGCGQKGPLVLPDAQRPHKKIGIGKPAQHASPPAQPAAPGSQPPAPGTQTPAGAAPSPPSTTPAPSAAASSQQS